MSIKLITAATVEPVTLAEAKAQCRVDVIDDDALFTGLIQAARELAEATVDRAYAPATYELILDAFPVGEIRIDKPPVQSITSIKYLDTDGNEQTMSSTDYVLDPDLLPGYVIPAANVAWPDTYDGANTVRVRFVAGAAAADVPQKVKLFMLVHIVQWYENRGAVSVGAPVAELPGIRALIDSERWSWF